VKVITIVVALAALTAGSAADAATLAGLVLASDGDPVPDATVSLVELRRQTTTDAEGRFRFEDLPAGELLVEVTSPRFGGTVQRVLLEQGSSLEVTLELDQLVHSDQITVTATGVARSLSEVVTPVDVLGGTELSQRRGATLATPSTSSPAWPPPATARARAGRSSAASGRTGSGSSKTASTPATCRRSPRPRGELRSAGR